MSVNIWKRAPALCGIIALKLGKGCLLLLLAIALMSLTPVQLQDWFQSLLAWLNLDPTASFISDMAGRIEQLNHSDIRVVAGAAALFGFLALIEGFGLSRRAAWAGWMAVCRSAVFLPFVMQRLLQDFNPILVSVLAANGFIVWYLLRNRVRIFHTLDSQAELVPLSQPRENPQS